VIKRRITDNTQQHSFVNHQTHIHTEKTINPEFLHNKIATSVRQLKSHLFQSVFCHLVTLCQCLRFVLWFWHFINSYLCTYACNYTASRSITTDQAVETLSHNTQLSQKHLQTKMLQPV